MCDQLILLQRLTPSLLCITLSKTLLSNSVGSFAL